MPLHLARQVQFGAFTVTSQVFHTTKHSFALVNLKPLLPGHVLVCPHRRVGRLSQLTPPEVSDLFQTVQRVGNMVERVFKASALNVAVQDGKDAGQSVEHVHCHIIPRHGGDLDSRGGSDAIYDMMNSAEGDIGAHQKAADDPSSTTAGSGKGDFAKPDAERLPRSMDEMQKEAQWLADEMDKGRALSDQ